MKILTLIIQQKFFDEIVKGVKTQEFRELRPKSEKRYIVYNDEGEFDLIEYDAIRFFVGYNKDRDTALVEVKGSFIQDLLDEDGNIVEFVDEKGIEYDAMNVVYDLGDVLEVNGTKK